MRCTSGSYQEATWRWACTSQMSPTSCIQALPWTTRLPRGEPCLDLACVQLCSLWHDSKP